MIFTRKYLVICLSEDFGPAYFNNKRDAVKYKERLEKYYIFHVFKLYQAYPV